MTLETPTVLQVSMVKAMLVVKLVPNLTGNVLASMSTRNMKQQASRVLQETFINNNNNIATKNSLQLNTVNDQEIIVQVKCKTIKYRMELPTQMRTVTVMLWTMGTVSRMLKNTKSLRDPPIQDT